MNTGIQYTTEWTFTRTVNNIEMTETCRLVKQLNGNNTLFYTNEEAMKLSISQYQQAFDNTIAYMQGLGWDELPVFDSSCKTNITDCPIVPPAKVTVVPVSFVCQESGLALAIYPPRSSGLTGWKFASVFQYKVNGQASGTTRLVKSFNGGNTTFYSDSEISMLASSDRLDAVHLVTYSHAFNLTLQYMTYLGWIATPDINVCRLVDMFSCPVGITGIVINALNFDLSINGSHIPYIGGNVLVTASLNGAGGQRELTEDSPSGYITLSDVAAKMDALNSIVIEANKSVNSIDITTMLDEDAEEAITEDTVKGIKKTLKLTGDTIDKYIIVNNGVKSLNVGVRISVLL
jgi:hypothetical protein